MPLPHCTSSSSELLAVYAACSGNICCAALHTELKGMLQSTTGNRLLRQGMVGVQQSHIACCCRCGPKGQSGDKEEDKSADEKEKPTLDKVVWEAKLKYLQVGSAALLSV